MINNPRHPKKFVAAPTLLGQARGTPIEPRATRPGGYAETYLDHK
jgi:hypothetical protein